MTKFTCEIVAVYPLRKTVEIEAEDRDAALAQLQEQYDGRTAIDFAVAEAYPCVDVDAGDGWIDEESLTPAE